MESGQSKHPKPNFLIVGAAKAGTTSLAKYLGEHPDIFIPEQKELRFFVKDILLEMNDKDPLKEDILRSSVFDEKEYFEIFDVPEKIAGDASVHYLYHHEEVIPKIKKHLGDIPIIIMLRNPVERAISNIKYLKTAHNNSMIDELNMELTRKSENYNSFWYHKELGLYFEQVKAYLSNFSRVKIILFEDFKEQPDVSYKEIISFLKLPIFTLNKYKIHNPAVEMRFYFKMFKQSGILKILKVFIPKETRNALKNYSQNEKFYKKITLTLEQNEKKKLMEYYKSDILNLEKLLEIDLSCWYETF